MKKIVVIFLCAFVLLSLFGCKPEDEAGYKGFRVSGTKILDANDNEFIMRGVNHAHTWYTDKLDEALTAISETGSNTVRIVLSNGSRWDKNSIDDVTNVVNKCKELEMIAILEVHDATGSDDKAELIKAAEYFIELKDLLIENEPYVIVNIANEWLGSNNAQSWHDGYKEAISMLREAGIRNLLMIDASGWGQYADSVTFYGASLFDSDPLKNLFFSIHMYEVAGKTEAVVKKNIDKALALNIPVVIGEFGHKHSEKPVAAETILSYCAEKGTGYLGWSWKGNTGGTEYLDIALDWDGSVLSADWGELLVNSEYGIKNTAKKCTVFD